MTKTERSIHIFREVRNVTTNEFGNLRALLKDSPHGYTKDALDTVRFTGDNPPRLTIVSPDELIRFHEAQGLPYNPEYAHDLAAHLEDTLDARVDNDTEASVEALSVQDTKTASLLYIGISDEMIANRALVRHAIQHHYKIDRPEEGAWDDPEAGVGLAIARSRHENAHAMLETLARVIVNNDTFVMPPMLQVGRLEMADYPSRVAN